MILGDAQEKISPKELWRRVLVHLEQAARSPEMENARAALIAAGQFEQALADAAPAPGQATNRLAEAAAEITDAAAAGFLAACGEPAPDGCAGAAEAVRRIGLLEPDLLNLPDGPLTVKVPEGFAFYALFPEQAADAARQWAARHPPAAFRTGTNAPPLLIVGIRSIGATLSAVVQAALRNAGHRATRCTVRPDGPPFNRRIDLPRTRLDGVEWVLVADEGPGLSGSSMAAAVFACERAGFPRSRISFLPAHGNGPGAFASEAVRECWEKIETFVGRPPDLPTRLAVAGERLLDNPPERAATLETFSGGAWRSHCFESPEQWPPVCPLLERTKFRLRLPGGPALLWKFAGFPGVLGQNAEADFRRLRESAADGWTPEPLGTRDGFIATRWIPGRPVRKATPKFLSRLARYLARSSSEALDEPEAQAAHERLRPLLEANLAPALGPELAARATELWSRAEPASSRLCADPQLALHEWIETPSGAFVKTDSTGHLCDHTLAGRQPLEWGIAAACGACDPGEVTPLLEWLRRNGLGPSLGSRLTAYRVTHAAYRLGGLELARGTAPPEERPGIEREAERFRMLARRLLA